MFIDSHSHLAEAEFEPDLSSVLNRARRARVGRVLVVANGGEAASLQRALAMAEREVGLDIAAGIHPHEAGLASDQVLDSLLRLAQRGRLVAWGEIGLDFHYRHAPPEVQQVVFSRQLTLAKEMGLPVVIHTREAEAQTLRILGEHFCDRRPAGVMHCFSGSLHMAQCCLEMGFHISFSGMLTFPKAYEIRRVAQAMPMDRLLIETDAPYLAPVPFRGKRNEPAFLIETARALAEVKQVSLEEVAKCTTANYKRLFDRSQAEE